MYTNCQWIVIEWELSSSAIANELKWYEILETKVQFLMNVFLPVIIQELKQTIGQKSKILFDNDANLMSNKTKMMPILHAL